MLTIHLKNRLKKKRFAKPVNVALLTLKCLALALANHDQAFWENVFVKNILVLVTSTPALI